MARETVSQTWQRLTGMSWSKARAMGLTNGSASANLALQKKLLGGWRPKGSKTTAKPVAAPAAASTTKKVDPVQDLKDTQNTIVDEYANEEAKYNKNIKDYNNYSTGWNDVYGSGYISDPATMGNYDMMGEDAKRYKLYNEELSKNSWVDPFMQRRIDEGIATEMTPESILRKYLVEVPAKQAATVGAKPAVGGEIKGDDSAKRMQESLKNLFDSAVKAAPGTPPQEVVAAANLTEPGAAYPMKFGGSGDPAMEAAYPGTTDTTSSEYARKYMADPVAWADKTGAVGEQPADPTVLASGINGVGLNTLTALSEGASIDYAERTRQAQAYAQQLLKNWRDANRSVGSAYGETVANREQSGLRGGVSNRQLADLSRNSASMMSNIASEDQNWRTAWMNNNRVANIGYADNKRDRSLTGEAERITIASPITNATLKTQWDKLVGGR